MAEEREANEPMAFVVGFTGTRNGMTDAQRTKMEASLSMLYHEHSRVLPDVPIVGLHGDCVGADADFDALCREAGWETWCRPCTHPDMRMRARTGAREIASPMAPMVRNRAIVAQAHVMFACPPTKERIKSGSGTWATIGFAKRAGVPLTIVFPDGDMEIEDGRKSA